MGKNQISKGQGQMDTTQWRRCKAQNKDAWLAFISGREKRPPSKHAGAVMGAVGKCDSGRREAWF